MAWQHSRSEKTRDGRTRLHFRGDDNRVFVLTYNHPAPSEAQIEQVRATLEDHHFAPAPRIAPRSDNG